MGYIIKDEKGKWIFEPDVYPTEKRARTDLALAVIGNGKAQDAQKYFRCKIVKTTKKPNVR
jgi:hypothetical protein